MIVIPIQVIFGLVLGGIGVVLLIIVNIVNAIRKIINKWKKGQE